MLGRGYVWTSIGTLKISERVREPGVTPVSFQIIGAIYRYGAQEGKILIKTENKRGKIVRTYADRFRIKFAGAPYNITYIYILELHVWFVSHRH